MSITLNFWIFFFVIVVLALLGTAVIYLLVCPKAHTHYHYYEYKSSKNYDRLYDLLVNNGTPVILVVRDKNGDVRRYTSAHPSVFKEYGREEYFLDERDGAMRFTDKKSFIGYCQYRDIEFLDMAKEINEETF